MTHPLTDELCDQIVSSTPPLPCDQQDRVLSYDGRILDGMFEECFEVEKHQIRAAADWQLEQVLKWIDCIGRFEGYNLDFHSDCDLLIRDIQKAMRPQEDNS